MRTATPSAGEIATYYAPYFLPIVLYAGFTVFRNVNPKAKGTSISLSLCLSCAFTISIQKCESSSISVCYVAMRALFSSDDRNRACACVRTRVCSRGFCVYCCGVHRARQHLLHSCVANATLLSESSLSLSLSLSRARARARDQT